MLRAKFNQLLQSYQEDKETFYDSSSDGKMSELTSVKLLTKDLPRHLRESFGLSEDYEIKGSAGKGRIADVPHICIFDTEITNSPKNGYYIAYLFDATFSKFYLIIEQGWTQYVETFKGDAENRIQKTTQKAQDILSSLGYSNFSPIHLNSRRLGRGYELGSICSITYEKDKLPEDAVLLQDLKNLLITYKKLKGKIGTWIMDIDVRIEGESPQRLDADNKPNTEFPVLKFPEARTLRAFDIFRPEFMGTSEINRQAANYKIRRKHGIVVNELANQLKSNGFKNVVNDKRRDLTATSPNGVKMLFEIKSNLTFQELCTAVGQLLIYSYKKITEPTTLVLVIPRRVDDTTEQALAHNGIRILYWGWQNEDIPVFKNLDSLENL